MSAESEPSATRVLAQAQAGFQQAREAAGGHDVDLTIAGRQVRLSFAGDGLRDDVVRAIAGSPATGSSPATGAASATEAAGRSTPTLSVEIWDAVSTGVSLERASSLSDLSGRLGLVEPLCDERFRVVLGPAIEIVDLDSGQAVYYVPDPRRLPYWERAHPARVTFAAWARSLGLQMCHAAAVGTGDAGLLVVGSGGSGKSTVALACLGAGMRCAGDDYVLIDGDFPAVVHSLYGSTLLRPDHQQNWPSLMPRLDNNRAIGDDDKAVMFTAPGAIGGGFELVGVIVPRVDDGDHGRLRPIGPAGALRALAPSSILQLGAFDAGTLRRLSALCRSLPCLELTLNGDVNEIPDAIRSALALALSPSEAVSA